MLRITQETQIHFYCQWYFLLHYEIQKIVLIKIFSRPGNVARSQIWILQHKKLKKRDVLPKYPENFSKFWQQFLGVEQNLQPQKNTFNKTKFRQPQGLPKFFRFIKLVLYISSKISYQQLYSFLNKSNFVSSNSMQMRK